MSSCESLRVPTSLDRRIALAIFAVLFSLYLLTFNGLFRSIDELALFSAAESLVQSGSLARPQLNFAPYHNPVGSLEPLQPLIAMPLYALAVRLPTVSNIHVTMLLNPLLTALTAVLLYLLVRQMGYAQHVSTGVALIYGLATLAWPYTRTFFREPLLGLLWTAALWAFNRWWETQRPLALTACLGLLLLAGTAKLTSLAVLPVYIVITWWRVPSEQRRVMAALFITLLILGGLLLVAMFRVRNQPLTSIMGAILNYQLGPALQRVYGLLISPGKGLFLYSPVLLASLMGFWRFRQRRPVEAFIAGGTLLALLGLYSSLIDWYGGVAWGPRFLVPALPLLVLPLAEVLASRRKIVLAAATVLVMLSLAIQVVASTATWTEYYNQLVSRFPQPEKTVGLDMRQLRRSPVVGQFRIWSPATFDLVWWHMQLEDGIIVMDRTLLGVLGLSATLSVTYLVISLPLITGSRRLAAVHSRSTILSHISFARWQAALTVLTLAGLAAGTITLLIRAAEDVQGYAGIRLSDVRQIAAWIGDNGQRPYTLVTVSNEFGFHLLKGYLKGRFTHYWFSPYQREGFDQVLTSAEGAQRLWLVVDRGHMPPDASGRDLEYWLNTHAYQFSGEWIQDYELLGYATPIGELTMRPVSYTWSNGIALVGVAQENQVVQPGALLRLEFSFTRVRPVTREGNFFVHLVSGQGEVIGSHDGPPQYGAAPVSTWGEGQVIKDLRAMVVPGDLAAGVYDLVVGFADDRGLVPLTGPEASGPPWIRVGQVVIAGPLAPPHTGGRGS